MPKIRANGVTINYEQQGSGEPLVLIPYLAADHACYEFQVADYARHFTCFSLDLRGTGESDKPAEPYTTEVLADDVAALMRALNLEQAHVAGLSLGAAVALWVAAKYPRQVKSLSVHAGWDKTDLFSKTVVGSWRVAAQALGSVADMAISYILPWCLTPELYAAKPEYIQSLCDFVRSRPEQAVADFLLQSDAVLTHDVSGHISQIHVPTLITHGRTDQLTSSRFATPLKAAIRESELVVFEGCAHAPLYEKVEEFNHRTLQFLRRRASGTAA